MIASFRHKGLKLLYEKGDRRRVRAVYVDKIERILARLDESTEPANMDLPGYRLHPLKGELAGFWSVSVSGNWRIVFRFEGANARDVDLVDYH
jgi:proteic killer suppression protein